MPVTRLLYDMGTQPIVITGLQKSGTTLMRRLLQDALNVPECLPGEALEFWGEATSGSATVFGLGPRGRQGHAYQADELKPMHAEELAKKLRALPALPPFLIFKNPYHSVRLSWVRKLLPHAFIICMTRDPVSNSYSLLKKYAATGDEWWGVKPDGWPDLVRENKLEQASLQWQMVTEAILRDRHHIDLLIDYAHLSTSPEDVIEAICRCLGVSCPQLKPRIAVENRNGEYLTGAPALSRNRAGTYKGSALQWRLKTIFGQRLPPLSEEAAALIYRQTSGTQAAVASALNLV
jgi:hypothetical protein